MIKEIGIRSRKKIEAMTGGPVHLNLHVKVSPKWFKNNFVLEEIGLPRAKDSSSCVAKKIRWQIYGNTNHKVLSTFDGYFNYWKTKCW